MSANTTSRGKQRRLTLAAVPLALVLFSAVNIASNGLPPSWGLDVTAAQEHTLSDATRRTLANIPEPVDLRLYISPAIRDGEGRRADYAQRVTEMLRRYARLADGGISLKVIYPAPFSETEDQALTDGLQPLRAGHDGQTGYFGLHGVNTTDDSQTIPAFDPARSGLLEPDLTRLIHNLAHPRKPRVGMLGRLSLKTRAEGDESGSTKPNRLRTVMSQQFDLQTIAPDARKLPEGLDTLLLAQPTGLSDELRQEIHRYVAAGGAVLAFVDPLSEALRYRREPLEGARPDSSLTDLLEQWGVGFTSKQFVGDRDQALTVRARVGGRDTDVDYIGWLGITPDNLSNAHGITAGLKRIVMKSAGSLHVLPDSGTNFQPLIFSSPNAALFDVNAVANGPDPAELLGNFPSQSSRSRRILGAEVHPSGSSGRVLVLADSDMLQDSAWLRGSQGGADGPPTPIADNGTLVLNALESLAGGLSLAGLSGGAPTDRPFTLIESRRKAAEQQFRARETELLDSVRQARSELQQIR